MSSKPVKVNDRRMFTATGELRDEFRHLENQEARPSEPAPVAAPSPEPPAPEPEPAAPAAPPAPRAEGYPDPEPGRAPGVMDLIGMLAEPASIYLREAGAGAGAGGTMAADSRTEQSLELARLHIDLLGVLRGKTAGHLDAREKAMLDDVVYRLQMGYAQLAK